MPGHWSPSPPRCRCGRGHHSSGRTLCPPDRDAGKRLAAEKKAKRSPAANQVNYAAEAQQSLSSALGRKVRIVTGRNKGRIELEYYGMDDLNDLLEALALLKQSRKGPKSP